MESGALFFFGIEGEFMVPLYFRDQMMMCITSGFLSYILGECGTSRIEEITKRAFDDAIRQIASLARTMSRSAIPSMIAFEYNVGQLRFLMGDA